MSLIIKVKKSTKNKMNFNYEDFDQSEIVTLMADQDQENRENEELFITMPIEITEGHELYEDLITSDNFFL